MDHVYGLFPRLAERRHQSAGTLSGGEQQMLALGRALMSRPKLLMMDEPSLGLAPLLVSEVFAMIRQIHDEGVTVLLIEQNAAQALKVADRGYVLETGRVVLTGTGQQLAADGRVQRVVLGDGVVGGNLFWKKGSPHTPPSKKTLARMGEFPLALRANRKFVHPPKIFGGGVGGTPCCQIVKWFFFRIPGHGKAACGLCPVTVQFLGYRPII